MITTEQYEEMWTKLQIGAITADDWQAFCMRMLEQVLEANKDVMVRLKNR